MVRDVIYDPFVSARSFCSRDRSVTLSFRILYRSTITHDLTFLFLCVPLLLTRLDVPSYQSLPKVLLHCQIGCGLSKFPQSVPFLTPFP